MDDKAPTHIAYALRRESRVRSRAIEIGNALIEGDPKAVHHVFIDRLPVGGFSGKVTLVPIGTRPPELELELEPERPSKG